GTSPAPAHRVGLARRIAKLAGRRAVPLATNRPGRQRSPGFGRVAGRPAPGHRQRGDQPRSHPDPCFRPRPPRRPVRCCRDLPPHQRPTMKESTMKPFPWLRALLFASLALNLGVVAALALRPAPVAPPPSLNLP